MMPDALEPWVPFVLAFGALGIAYRLVTGVTVALFYRLTHHTTLSMLLYALFVWPGTVVHEFAHWLVAGLLGVRAGFPHLIPSKVDSRGRMVLGHVRVERTDFVRGSLIGMAPFLFGSAAVALLARHAFALPIPAIEELSVQSLSALLYALPTILSVPDAWLYLYILFAIANGMMPSPSDREAWPALLLFVLLVGALLFFVVGVRQIPEAVALWGLRASTWLTFAFIITIVLDGLLLLVLWPLERLLWMAGR